MHACTLCTETQSNHLVAVVFHSIFAVCVFEIDSFFFCNPVCLFADINKKLTRNQINSNRKQQQQNPKKNLDFLVFQSENHHNVNLKKQKEKKIRKKKTVTK